jgi:hypothetical protein
VENQPSSIRPLICIYDFDHPPALFHLRAVLKQLGASAQWPALSAREGCRFLLLGGSNASRGIWSTKLAAIEDLKHFFFEQSREATIAGIPHVDIQHNVAPDVRLLIKDWVSNLSADDAEQKRNAGAQCRRS